MMQRLIIFTILSKVAYSSRNHTVKNIANHCIAKPSSFINSERQYSIAAFRNEDLMMNKTAADRFHPKVNFISTCSLSTQGPNNKNFIFLYDALFDDSSLVLIVSRYFNLAMNSFHVRMKGENEDLNLVQGHHPKTNIKSDPNSVMVLSYGSNMLSSMLALYRLRPEYLGFSSSSPSSLVEFSITAGSQRGNINVSVTPSWPNGDPLDLVSCTMLGYDFKMQELKTWMQYHLSIGIQHFFLYLLFPLECLTDAEMVEFNSLALFTKYSFTVVQWHPYFIDNPMRDKGTAYVGVTQLPLLQSNIYRLKNSIKDTWIAHIDLDEYLVVNPEYKSLRSMAQKFSKSCGSLTFLNSYFVLAPSGSTSSKNSDFLSSVSFPSNNFTFADFTQNDVVYETNLFKQYERTKVVYRAKGCLFAGAHYVAMNTKGYVACWAKSIYLHYAKQTKGRNASIIVSPRVTTLKALLDLPRNDSNPIFSAIDLTALSKQQGKR